MLGLCAFLPPLARSGAWTAGLWTGFLAPKYPPATSTSWLKFGQTGSYSLSATDPPADKPVNQYTSTPFDSREYDLRGNLVKVTLRSGGSRTMEYDYRNMMTKFTDEFGKVTRYEYDAFLRRARKIEDAGGSAPVETRYLHKGWQVVEERDGNNDTAATYVHGNYIDETIQMQRGANSYYFHSDDLYSTVMLTDANANIVETTVYSDYGEPRWFNAAGANLTESSVGNVRAFQGREWEGAGIGYTHRYRVGEPQTATWTANDPKGIWGDLRSFGHGSLYLAASPQVFIDPLGLSTDRDWATTIAPGGNFTRRAYGCFDCKKWADNEAQDLSWTLALPACPCSIPLIRWISPTHQWSIDNGLPYPPEYWDYGLYLDLPDGWDMDLGNIGKFHYGAAFCIRSGAVNGHGQQCCYDGDRRLITHGSGAGTPDKAHWMSFIDHRNQDWGMLCDCKMSDYERARPPNNKNGCPANSGKGDTSGGVSPGCKSPFTQPVGDFRPYPPPSFGFLYPVDQQ